VQRHTYSNNLVILAVLLEVERFVALVAVNNQQLVGTNSTLLCMRVKVLQPHQTKVISSPAVIRDSNNPILGQVFLLVPAREVVARLEDNKGQNGLSFSINALYNRCPLLVALLDCL
jgi:hypothetical protein